jgi:hypothetical protein
VFAALVRREKSHRPRQSRSRSVAIPNWECKEKHQRRQFSAKVGTIFEDSPIDLGKWFAAIWMVANCKNGISSYEMHRALGVTQKTAWFMDHRIRLAMQTGTFLKMSGEVEADETFIGSLKGPAAHIGNMHRLDTARSLVAAALDDTENSLFARPASPLDLPLANVPVHVLSD